MKQPTRTSVPWLSCIGRRCCAALILAMAIGAGCNSSDLALAPVTGVLRRGAEPLANYRLTAFPQTGPIASATTDDAGRFAFRTGDADGAVIASHTIVLTPPSKRGDVPMPGLGEVIAGPVVDTKSGVDPALQLRDESPLKLTLTDSEARDVEIDVETKTIVDAG